MPARDGAGLVVLPVTAADRSRAAALAAELSLPLAPVHFDPDDSDYRALLLTGRDGLSLQLTGHPVSGPVTVDFAAGRMRHRRRGGHNEPLGRAVGAGRNRWRRVVDATAGLGQDAFVLADLGCEVTLCERDPVVAALLADGIRRAAASGDPWLQAVVQGMRLVQADARRLPQQQLAATDVLYLDPMFPARGRRAAAKKGMALFQALLSGSAGGEGEADALLAWALGTGVPRVVVKRPRRAPPLAGRPPSHQLAGRSVRFDVYAGRPGAGSASVPGAGKGDGGATSGDGEL